MKTLKITILLLLLSYHSFAQCYSKIVSYSRNYIALQTDGTLWAKGTAFNYGLLGFGNSGAVNEFTQIGTDSDWTDNISLNGVNVFAIKTDGTLWVWGRNLSGGSAGLGTYDDLGYFGPTQVGTDSDWAEVASGIGFTLAIKTDGTLWVWGSNAGGRLGIGNLDSGYKTNVPIQVGVEANWTKVFAGQGSAAYAIKTDETLWSWGNNGSYIGYADASANNNFRTPHQVGSDTWTTIAIGGIYPMTDGIKTDGSMWGWGSSDFQTYFFGNGIDVYSSQIPVRIGNDSDWKEVCLSQTTSIALKNDNTRWGWGRNGTGYELGMGTGMTSNVTIPTQLDSNVDWKTISIDIFDNYGDGIKENNTLYHWGNTHTNVIYQSPTLFSDVSCTLAVNDFSNITITVLPNPTAEFTSVHLSENMGSQAILTITNQLGQELVSKNMEIVNQQLILNLSQYTAGVYYLTLRNYGRTFKTKLIKN